MSGEQAFFAAARVLPGPFVSFESVKCFKVVVRTGEGIEDDPVRWVTAWFTDDGTLVHYEDNWTENVASEPAS